MLKSTEKLTRKERPLADLAIKTLEQCRKAYEPVYAMLPPQVRGMLEGIQRRQDFKGCGAIQREDHVRRLQRCDERNERRS